MSTVSSVLFAVIILSFNCILLLGSSLNTYLAVRFYMYSLQRWNEGGQTAFNKIISTVVSSYCYDASHIKSCGFNTTNDVNFTSSNVMLSRDSPQQLSPRYLKINFNVTYLVGNTSFTLPSSIVAEIVKSYKVAIETAMGVHIEGIGNQFYTLPPDILANKIIIPISVLSTFVLIVIAFIFRHKQSHSEHVDLARQQQATLQKSHKKSKPFNPPTTTIYGGKEDGGQRQLMDPAQEPNSKPSWSNKNSSNLMTGGRPMDKFQDTSAEYNNIGYDKSMTEQDITAASKLNQNSPKLAEELPEVGFSGVAGTDSAHSADNFIEVRPDQSDNEKSIKKKKDKKERKKKKKHRRSGGDNEADQEELVPMEGAAKFNHPANSLVTSDTDNNLVDAQRDRIQDSSITSLDPM